MHTPLRSEADAFRLVIRAGGRESEILVVTPALTSSQLKYWTSDLDEAMAAADRRRERSVHDLERARRDLDLPITQVIVDLDAEREQERSSA